MRIMALLTCIAVMALAGCDGTPLPVNASGVCRGVGRELIGAEGKTWADQEKIDATLERLISIRCIARKDLQRAKRAIKATPAAVFGGLLK